MKVPAYADAAAGAERWPGDMGNDDDDDSDGGGGGFEEFGGQEDDVDEPKDDVRNINVIRSVGWGVRLVCHVLVSTVLLCYLGHDFCVLRKVFDRTPCSSDLYPPAACFGGLQLLQCRG